ncbi:ribonuclease activity regulator RraA [Polaromonas glacialis]|uniref:ribonuclease activity regulator RraA n=1 Tax=Polaromonas glacialis TaxID=866564 RepID=UPI000494EC80|nr:ribonuclease activity regulator RraA [Polaromonas glacialis]
MTYQDIPAELRASLMKTSAASISTQLIRRGLRNVAIRGVRPLNPDLPPMVGPAFTLRYVPAREDLDAYGSGGDPQNIQRQAIEVAPSGHVFVVDCRGVTDIAGIGAILGRRLLQRGLTGIVLDGGVRDTHALAVTDMPVYCAGPSAPPNYTGHHAADMNIVISCGGVAVYPGDIIFGDCEAVVVIPRHLAEEIAADAVEMERRERFLFAQIEEGNSINGVYPPSEETLHRYAIACEHGLA